MGREYYEDHGRQIENGNPKEKSCDFRYSDQTSLVMENKLRICVKHSYKQVLISSAYFVLEVECDNRLLVSKYLLCFLFSYLFLYVTFI